MGDDGSNILPMFMMIAMMGVGAYLLFEYVIKPTIKPGPVGGSCTEQGTPCNAAIAPYQQQLNICAQRYAQYMDSFIQENAAANHGFTQAQLEVLDQLDRCIDENAEKISEIAKQYTPADIGGVIAYAGAGAVLVATSAVGAAAYRKITGKAITSGISEFIKNAISRKHVIQKTITPAYASKVQSDLGTMFTKNVSRTRTFWNRLAQRRLLTQQIAQRFAAEEEAAMEADVSDALQFLRML